MPSCIINGDTNLVPFLVTIIRAVDSWFVYNVAEYEVLKHIELYHVKDIQKGTHCYQGIDNMAIFFGEFLLLRVVLNCSITTYEHDDEEVNDCL